MGIMLVVTLYTSRIVLQQLGIVDFGIYNVVAGVVMLMGFFNGVSEGKTAANGCKNRRYNTLIFS